MKKLLLALLCLSASHLSGQTLPVTGLPANVAKTDQPCQLNSYAPVSSDGSIPSCSATLNSGLMLMQSSAGTDQYGSIPVGGLLLTLQNGFPVVIDSSNNVTPLVNSGTFSTTQSILVDSGSLILGTGGNSPSYVQYANTRAASGYSSGMLGGLGAGFLQGNGKGVCFSSGTSLGASSVLGCYEANGFMFMGSYASHSSSPLWLDPAGVVNAKTYNQWVRPSVTNYYTVDPLDSTIPVDTNTNALNILVTLETTPTVGHTFTVKRTTSDAHTVTIQFPNGVAGTIDGSATYQISNALGSVTLVAVSATQYMVLGKV